MRYYNQDAIQKMINSGEYWVMEVYSDEWFVVIGKMARDFVADETKTKVADGDLLMTLGDTTTLVLIRKAKLTAAQLASRIGVDEIGRAHRLRHLPVFPAEVQHALRVPRLVPQDPDSRSLPLHDARSAVRHPSLAFFFPACHAAITSDHFAYRIPSSIQ